MPPYEIPDKIDEAFVQSLVDRNQPENKHFEFKRQLNIETDKDKRKLLAILSAFANTEGGFLIYGIKEGFGDKRGKAAEICGFSYPHSDDSLKLQIEGFIRSGVDPSLVGVEIETIPMDSDRCVIVIHVPQSRSRPHQVTFRGRRSIHARHSSGIYEPDSEELRQMISSSTSAEIVDSPDTAATRIRNFREERVEAILKGTFPANLEPGPKYIMHVVPLSAGSTRQQFDLSVLTDPYGTRFEHNLDGIHTQTHTGIHFQVFHNGSIEFVQDHSLSNTGNGYISVMFEASVRILGLPNALKWQNALGVSPPCLIMLSLLNVKGSKMAVHEMKRFGFLVFDEYEQGEPIRIEHLLVPEVVAETLEPNLDSILRPAFDRIWQATGFPRSELFDEQGKWRGPKQ